MPWGYLSSENDNIQYKRFIYTIYTTQYLSKLYKNISINVLSTNLFPCVWYSLSGQLIRKKDL